MIVEIGFALLVSAGYIPDDSSPFLEHLNHLATKWRVVPRRRDHPGSESVPASVRPGLGPAGSAALGTDRHGDRASLAVTRRGGRGPVAPRARRPGRRPGRRSRRMRFEVSFQSQLNRSQFWKFKSI